MPHLNDEQLIAHHYRDEHHDAHLRECADCRAQYETLARVLALVDDMPVPERGPAYGEQVWNRLRWRLERRRRRTWQSLLAVAATLAIAFFAGELWHSRQVKPATPAPQIAQTATTQPLNHSTTEQGDKVLIFVVSDHLDETGRVLAEVANADPKKSLDVSNEQKRAEDLVEANRIYRLTATQRGDARIASLLSDIEPILVELSHSGAKLTPEELTAMQKRIDSKGLLFKVRVMSAQQSQRPANNPGGPTT
jgi:hypothetical protein